MANTIDILGKLNSITSDQTLADAKQIEIAMDDGTTKKVPEVIASCAKCISGDNLNTFVTTIASASLTDRLFICTSSFGEAYVLGHIYYFHNGALTDITPATGSGGGTSANGVNLDIIWPASEVGTSDAISVSISWSSTHSGYGVVYCLVDGTISTTYRMLQGSKVWSVTGLDRGTHTLSVYVIDSSNTMSSTKSYSMAIGTIDLSSTFDDSKIYELGKTINISYVPFYIDSTALNLVVSIDGTISDNTPGASDTDCTYSIENLSAGIHTITLQLTNTKKDGTAQSSSVLSFTIIVAAEGVLYLTSETDATVNLTNYDSLALTARVAYLGAKSFSVTVSAVASDGTDLTSYNANLPKATWYNGNNTLTVATLPGIGTFTFTLVVSYGTLSKSLAYTVVVSQSALKSISYIKDDLILDLSTENKSNDYSDKNVWLDKSTSNVSVDLHDLNYSSNGWLKDSDGYSCLTLTGGAYAEINLKPFATEISETSNHGFTFDIEFSTEDVLDSSARVVSCFSGTRGFWIDTEYATLANNNTPTETVVTEGKPVTDPDTGEVTIPVTKTGPFQTNFHQNERTHVTFVIDTNPTASLADTTYDYPFACMIIYVNGVLTEITKINANTFFEQAYDICLGCANDKTLKGSCNIYNVRAYSRALKANEVLTNYIADIRDATRQNDMIVRNSLAGTTNSNALPIMELIFTAENYNSMSKETKIFGKINFTDTNDNSKSFSEYTRCQWQGTSTLAYAVKNLKLKLYTTLETTGTTVSGGTKYKYDLGNGIADNTFTLKADYMDSAHCRNTATANYVSAINSLTEESLDPAQQINKACRTSIYGFPILLHVVLADDIDNPTQTERKNYIDLGVFNFNLDKSSNKSLGLFDDSDMKKMASTNNTSDIAAKYPNWDCISFEGSSNSDSSAGAFYLTGNDKTDDISLAADFELRFEEAEDLSDDPSTGKYVYDSTAKTVTISKINTDLNGVYTIDTTKNALILSSGKYELTKSNGTISATDLSGTYTMDYGFGSYTTSTVNNETVQTPDDKTVILTITPDSEGATSGSVVSNENRNLRVDRRYGHLKKLLKWVNDTADDPVTFKADFSKHFNLQATLDYYCIVLEMLMVDNFGKNVMWNTWGPASTDSNVTYTSDEISKYDNYIWYPQFYDMDTSLGLDNSGNMRFDVSEEVSSGVFNTSNSKLWKTFRTVFADEIKAHYEKLRETSGDVGFTFKSLWKYFYTDLIEKIPEDNYNRDFIKKYLNHTDYLYMCHGNQTEFLRRFFEQRLYFLDTTYEYGNDYNSQSTVRVNVSDYSTTPVVFSIKTYQPAYVKIIYRNDNEASVVTKKVERNAEVTFSGYVASATDQEIRIFNSPNIKTIGDVSAYAPTAVLVGAMTRLTELSVGTSTNLSPNLKSLDVSSNTYLTKLIAENCTGINSTSATLDVSKCVNLRELSTKGSAFTSVLFTSTTSDGQTVSSGGALEKVTFSKRTTTVKLENFSVLTSVIFEGLSNLTTLEIKNCPLLLGSADSDNSYAPESGYFFYNQLSSWEPTAIDTNIDLEFYGNFGNTLSYKFLDACANLSKRQIAAGDSTSNKISLVGTINYLGNTIPNMYSSYKVYYPKLTVKYPNVNNVSYMFQNYKNINCIYSLVVSVIDDSGKKVNETQYFWTDTRAADFDSTKLVTIDNVIRRPISVYDETDQETLTAEIKNRLAPFSKFTNMSSMFSGDSYLESLDQDTFAGIDVSSATNTNMFYECNNLKYVQLPDFTKINAGCFYDVYNAVIFIPKSITDIDESAFYSAIVSDNPATFDVLLFEKGSTFSKYIDATETLTSIVGAKYALFNIVPDTVTTTVNGVNISAKHAMITNTIEYQNNTISSSGSISSTILSLNESYFKHYDSDTETSNIIYSLDSTDENDSTISVSIFNATSSTTDGVISIDYYADPLNIYELLPSSLSNFDASKIVSISVPSNHGINLETGDSASVLLPINLNINRKFMKISDISANVPSIDHVYILSDHSTEVSPYLFSLATLTNCNIEYGITKIGNKAFEKSKLQVVTFNKDSMTEVSSLTDIEDYAFSSTQLTNIYIPETVTKIGQYAYSFNDNIVSITYSSSMTEIPIGCFSQCDTKNVSCTAFSGFSPNIVTIGDQAFSNSIGLKPFSTDTTNHICYWTFNANASGTNTNFLSYFTNLTDIGSYAFRGISGISEIVISSKLNSIGGNAFNTTSNINDATVSTDRDTYIVWLDSSDKYSNLTIGEYAFANRDLIWKRTSLSTSDSVEYVDSAVFIPKSVKTIGEYAFSSSADDSLYMNYTDFIITDAASFASTWNSNCAANYLKIIVGFTDAVTKKGGVNEGDAIYFVTDDSTDIPKKALLAKLLATTTTDTDGTVTTSYASAIIIPSAITYNSSSYMVTELLPEAFVGADSKLTTINFKTNPNLTTIGAKLFTSNIIYNIYTGDDTNTTTYIPTSVTYIGPNTPFKDTQWFKNFGRTVTADTSIILNNTFIGYVRTSDSTTSIIDLSGNTIADFIVYDSAFASDQYVESIILPDSLTSINDRAFYNCQKLKTVKTKAAKDTTDFNACFAESDHTAYPGLTYIGENAFNSCSALTSIEYPSTVTHVGSGSILGSGITKISFEEGCKLDNQSYPLCPVADINGTEYNTTITFLHIPASLGYFYSYNPNGHGYAEFSKLAGVTTLLLGSYTKITQDSNTYDLSTDSYYSANYPDAVYTSSTTDGVTTKTPVTITLDDSEKTSDGKYVFYRPDEKYGNTIDVSYFGMNSEGIASSFIFSNAALFSMVMGFKVTPASSIYANLLVCDQINKTAAFASLFNRRLSVNVVVRTVATS